MKTQDQQKKMKMQAGGVSADVAAAGPDYSGFEKRLQEIGKFAEGIGTAGDRQILEDILASRQAQEFLSGVGGVAVPKSKQLRKPRPIEGARGPRMD
jgi:hypothetical protein